MGRKSGLYVLQVAGVSYHSKEENEVEIKCKNTLVMKESISSKLSSSGDSQSEDAITEHREIERQMSRKDYKNSNNEFGKRKDTSFATCITLLLFFLCASVLILAGLVYFGRFRTSLLTREALEKLSVNESKQLYPNINDGTSTLQPRRECLTPECKKLSATILGSMDHKAEPCTHFSHFACGGQKSDAARQKLSDDAKKRIKLAMSRINSSSSAPFHKLKQFHASCFRKETRKTRVDRAKNIFNNVGSFIVPVEEEGEIADITTLIYKLIMHNSPLLFDVDLDVDSYITERFAPRVIFSSRIPSIWPDGEEKRYAHCRHKSFTNDQTSNINRQYDLYTECKKNLTSFLSIVDLAANELQLSSVADKDHVIEILYYVVNLFQPLKEYFPSEIETSRVLSEKEYIEYRIEDLNNKYHHVNWTSLFELLLNQEVSSGMVVQVYFDKAFDLAYKVIGKHSRRQVYNALLGVYLGQVYYDIVEYDVSSKREEFCFHAAVNMIPDVVNAAYISTFNDYDISQFKNFILHESVTSLTTTFLNLLDKNTYLSMEVIEDIRTKFISLEFIVNNSMDIYNTDTLLNKRYEQIIISDYFLHNVITLAKHKRNVMYSLIKLDPKNSIAIWTYFSKSFESVPRTIHGLNIIVIPLGMYHRAFSNRDGHPPYPILAEVDFAIAKAIFQAFDTTGRKYGIIGTVDVYFQKSFGLVLNETYYSCYKNLFHNSTFTIPLEDGSIVNYTMDFSYWFNMIFTDAAAANLVWPKYQSEREREYLLPWIQMTPDQVFYLATSQALCSETSIVDDNLYEYMQHRSILSFIRIQSLVELSDYFQKTFHCESWKKQCPVFPAPPYDMKADTMKATTKSPFLL